jgi:predicted enzyme related to lactoylglutathione lyase
MISMHPSEGEKLGGKVVVPKTVVPGMGYYSVCVDTENNSFGIFESNENAK